MYKVLYRKYRPRYFADVIGQPQVTETLKNELASDRIAHAYLFTGSRGTGKTTCSKILSKAVNCLDPHNGDPCGECEICRGIDDGSIMDVVEIDAASNNGVDDIRLLREEADFTPANARYRVYIIDEVHMLSIGAFNALLKTLEEPPAHVVFILATTEVHKLPATILSRCQRFDFRRIAPQDIAARLEYVCEQENVSIDREAALMVAAVADGAMRDALSLLDQCMSKSHTITVDVVRTTAGLADRSFLFDLTEKIISNDAAGAVEIIDSLYRESKDMARLCTELCEHFRAIMLIKTVKIPQNILVMSESELQRLKEQSQKLTLDFTINTIEALQAAAERMLRGANRRIEAEMTLVRLCSKGFGGTAIPQNIEERLKALEHAVTQIKAGGSTGAKPSQPHISVSPPQKRPSVEEMQKLRSAAVPMAEWPDVIDELKKTSLTVATSFAGSTAYISGQYVLIDASNDFCFELLRESGFRKKMRDAIRLITGKEYKLGRYSYSEDDKPADDLARLVSDLKSAGIPVEDKNKN